MNASAFLYNESSVARAIGISRDDLREWRDLHLEEGADWKKNGRLIALSEDGLRRIAKLRSIPFEKIDLATCLEKNGAVEVKKMRVVPPLPLNTRVLYAEDEDGERHLVDVGRNTNFVFDDTIEVGPHEVQQGIWQLLSEVPRDRRRPHYGN